MIRMHVYVYVYILLTYIDKFHKGDKALSDKEFDTKYGVKYKYIVSNEVVAGKKNTSRFLEISVEISMF